MKPHQERSWPVIVSNCLWGINTYHVQFNYCRRGASCLVKLLCVIALETRRNWTYLGVSYHGITACKAIIQGDQNVSVHLTFSIIIIRCTENF